MNRLLYCFISIFSLSVLMGSCSQESKFQSEPSEDSMDLIKMYEKYYNQTAKSYNHVAQKLIFPSRGQSEENINLLAYLLTLPKSTIDSLMDLYTPSEAEQNKIDSLKIIGVINFCDIYGDEAYQNYVNFFENIYQPGNGQMLIDETESVIDPLQPIYMYTGASIDFVRNNIEFDPALLDSVNNYPNRFEEKSYRCLHQIATRSRSELITQVLENAICIFEIEDIANDLIVVGEDLMTIIQLVHDYHKCMEEESTI